MNVIQELCNNPLKVEGQKFIQGCIESLVHRVGSNQCVHSNIFCEPEQYTVVDHSLTVKALGYHSMPYTEHEEVKIATFEPLFQNVIMGYQEPDVFIRSKVALSKDLT